ncbi:D-aminoacyl-tRNA deacylase [Oxalobacter aliiformigenes]|uniref:D-aminoacyl-tRNA deacylase n=1 Tax=Oxalobacter aliiformigenes TaxID=2946593 RepID=UPI0022B0596F|nr:D-aminoacyl-tRNA deacylase [Oxalobacter aliiformigenes]MCZ4063971.1 D-aminoacyl-tRNA deacylase [Oxalobacter aliiformigenes]WAV98590.1 D-aminoacyl-tRNA deacylase [Oxalobacter aliiformigenes]
MISLLQRVSQASVTVEHEEIGRIGRGLLVLLCAERNDTEKEADQLLERILNYRVFSDENGKMNRSVISTGGELLIVPQFTLAADTKSGTRPSFTPAAPPDIGKKLFDYFVSQAKARLSGIQTGQFGADMQVALVNDGPVTFWLDTSNRKQGLRQT